MSPSHPLSRLARRDKQKKISFWFKWTQCYKSFDSKNWLPLLFCRFFSRIQLPLLSASRKIFGLYCRFLVAVEVAVEMAVKKTRIKNFAKFSYLSPTSVTNNVYCQYNIGNDSISEYMFEKLAMNSVYKTMISHVNKAKMFQIFLVPKIHRHLETFFRKPLKVWERVNRWSVYTWYLQ